MHFFVILSGENPEPIVLHGGPISNNLAGGLPIAVVAANRPAYLFRMLKRLLKTPGVNKDQVTVYIDGFFQEPKDVVELFGVSVVEHEPICSRNCRISQVELYKDKRECTFLYKRSNYHALPPLSNL